MSIETIEVETLSAGVATKVETVVVGITGPQGPQGAQGGAGSGSTITVQEGDATVLSEVATLDFGAGFDVTEAPSGEANIALDLTEYGGGALPVGGGGTGATTASGARTALELGTSAVKDVAATGDASSTQVVLGNDTRLTDARTPTTHTHTTAAITDFAEDVRDTIAGALVAGTNVTITVSDPGDTITIAATGGTGSGDVVGPAASVDNELALFSGTGGKTIKRATTTGIVKATSGVIGAATAGTDYYAPGSTDVAVADGGTGSSTAAGARTNLGLGTAAEKDAPASGDATSAQVVLGNDTRLTDARTPSAHKASHATGGTDALAASDIGAQASNSLLTAVAGLSANGLVARTSSSAASARTITGGTALTVTNGDGVSGNPTLALDQDLIDLAGLAGVRGDVIYRDASQWQRLAKGTAGQLLAIGANDPAWSGSFGRVLFHDATGGSQVVSTTTETTLLSATYTLAANQLANVGDCLQVWASGVLKNSTGAGQTYTLQIGPDAATSPTLPCGSLPSNAAERGWLLDVRIRADVVGASPTLIMEGYFIAAQTNGAADPLSTLSSFYTIRSAATWSTASSQTFDFRVTLSASNASLYMTCDTFSLIYLPKAI